MKRYDYIDALRGIAILGVLLAHTTLYGNNHYPFWFYEPIAVDVGPRGVQLFYLVSAFTLCLSFSQRSQNEKHPIRNFYIRRFFRIAPLFYLAILYYLWQNRYWYGNPNQYSLLNIVATFTFINGASWQWINNIVLGGWSIAVETTFYLLFPFLFKQLKTIQIAVMVTFGTMIIMQLVRLYLLTIPFIQSNPDIQTYTFEFFPSQLPIFLTGMTLFLLMKKSELSQKDKKILYISGLVLILILFIQTFSKEKLIAGHYIYGLCFALLLFFLSKQSLKILVNPVTIFLGKISFSIYLSHIAVLYWLNRMNLVNLYPSNALISYSLRFIMLLICSSAVSTLLFYIVERRGQLLGKLLIAHFDRAAKDNISKELKTW